MDGLKNYHEILGVKPGASVEEIRLAYKDLVDVWHPDRFTHNPRLHKTATEKLKDINIAYQRLLSFHENKHGSDFGSDYSGEPPKEPPPPPPQGRNKTYSDWLEMGNSLIRSGNYNDAIGAYCKAIELDPVNAAAYYSRGMAYEALGNDKKAVDDLKAASRLNLKEAQDFLRSHGVSW